MPRSLSIVALLSLLLTTAACPTPPVDDAEDGTGDSETGDGDGDPGDGDGDGDNPAQACASACAAQAECDVIGADEIADCVQTCETRIEALEVVFGSECAEAQELAQVCYMTQECEDTDEPWVECDPLGVTAYYACTETEIPEIDALCECEAAKVEPLPGEPLPPKEQCVVDLGEFAVNHLIADGQACLNAIAELFACDTASCEDPACDAEPTLDMCVCVEEDDVIPECPTNI